jgi:integrase
VAAAMERTKTPGVYRGSRYVVTWRDASGKPREKSARTYDEARGLKRRADQQARDGEAHVPAREQATLAEYARDFYGADLEREEGAERARGRSRGRRGAVRDSTRAEYARQIEADWLPELGARRLPSNRTPDIVKVLGKIAARDGDDYLSDATLRRLFAPLQALLATAVEEGEISHNPARDVTVPSGRDKLRRLDDDEDEDDAEPGKARALTVAQLSAFLLVVDVRWRLLLELLAATELRISEALALRWRDLQLDGERPVVRVRRAYVKDEFGPPKSEHGRRQDVPIPFDLVRALSDRRKTSEWHGDSDLVWPSMAGTVMEHGNLRRRVLEPAMHEAGASWAGFHAFRHSCASRLIAAGRNIVQVSRWLGHHSPEFTLSSYARLMDEGVGDALELPSSTAEDRAVSRQEAHNAVH